jgi:hypothetical protein
MLAALAGLLAATALAHAATSGGSADEWTVSSPDGTLTARVTAHRGAYALTVEREGWRVLATPLGSARGAAGAATSDLHEAFSTPAGKRRHHLLDGHRLTLSFAGGRRIEVLATDDGVALRQTGAGTDPTAWRAPRATRAWLQRYRPDYEAHYDAANLRSARAGDYGFPALLATAGGTYALLTESGLTRQAAAHLRANAGTLRVVLPDGERPPRTTPWRVAVIGPLATVVRSELVLDLGSPSEIGDTSWIHPGRVAWSWWSDVDSPGDVRRQRAFIRSAQAYGWEYDLLDEGWKAQDVPGLVRYARKRGVRLMLWTPWKALRDPATRARLLSQWAAWGVAGVKVDFLLSDAAKRMAIYDDIARDAAQRHLVVAFHGCTIPRGIQRTWPNVLTMEAVEGTERETPGQGTKAMDPAQDVDLAFTRNAIGPMDYTPVTFSARNRRSTDAHRLALAVVYESGLQHLADTPESYRQHPQAAQLLRDLPTAWDDVRLLDGAPDRDVTLARRAGAQWWLGSLSATGARTVAVPLRFLPAGRSYDLHLVRDAGDGTMANEDRTVTRDDTLHVAEEPDGGFAAELTPRA